mgnify:FL=1
MCRTHHINGLYTLRALVNSLVQEGKATVVQSSPILDCDIPKIRGEDWDGNLFDVKGASATMASTYIKKLSFDYEAYTFSAKDLKKFATDHSMTLVPLLRTKYIPCNVHSCFCQVSASRVLVIHTH